MTRSGLALVVVALLWPAGAPAEEQGIDGFDEIWTGRVPHAMSVAASGDFVYVNGAERRLEVHDFSDLQNPRWVASFPPGGWRLELDGDDLYSFGHSMGVQHFDVSLEIPRLVGSFSFGDPLVSFAGGARVGDSLFVAAHQTGIHVLRMGPPMEPLSVIDLEQNAAYDLARAKGHFLVANGRYGLTVLSIDPLPRVEATLALPGLSNDVLVAEGDSVAFVSLGPGGIASVDITDIRDPQIIEIQETRGNAWEMSMLGTQLYVGAYTQVERYDASDPTRLRRVAWDETEHFALGVAPMIHSGGDTLLAVADWAGLRLYEMGVGSVPDIAFSAERIDFGVVAATAVDTVVRVFNTGSATLEAGVVSFPAEFEVSPRRFSIPPGEVRDVFISTSGDRNISGAIRFFSNDPDEGEFDQLVYKNNTTFPQVGSPAPDFTLVGTDGEEHSLSDYVGRPVYLQFGADW